MSQHGSNLNNPALTTALFAIMVQRLGGSVVIRQEDFDKIAGLRMVEEGDFDGLGSISFQLMGPKNAQS